MKSLDFSLLLIEGENVGTYLKSNITMTTMSGIFFATGLSVRDAMHTELLFHYVKIKSSLNCFLNFISPVHIISRRVQFESVI